MYLYAILFMVIWSFPSATIRSMSTRVCIILAERVKERQLQISQQKINKKTVVKIISDFKFVFWPASVRLRF